jgi:tetratricopeptide (TPR) repeat protein
MSGPVLGNTVQAGSIGAVHFHDHGTTTPTPAQLPAGGRGFVGRRRHLDQLGALDVPLVVLSGGAGSGKTALAVRFLHDVHDNYPDGQLFVDLGTVPGMDPVDPGDVLEWFLLSLGVAAKAIPLGTAHRAAMFRSVTADRRLIVLLDNAVSAAQVRPLLPATPGAAVVTSRYRLSGLAMDGARWIEIGPLDQDEAVDLFRAVLGEARVDAELESVHEVVQACASLPLALSILAARLATHPRRTFARELQDLRAESDRLAALAIEGDRSVRAVLDVACAALDNDAALAYRACARLPGLEFGIDVATFVTGWDNRRTLSSLDTLVDANLLVERGDDRLGYHQLTLLHAREWGEPDNRTPSRQAIIEWYLDRTIAADLLIHPHRPRLGPRYATSSDPVFSDHRAALGWLEVERASIKAAFESASHEGRDDLLWQFAEALWGFFLHTRHYSDWISLHHVAIAAAGRAGGPRVEARMRSQLGLAYAKLRRYDLAAEENRRALRLAEEAGDDQAMATAYSQLGRAARGSGELDAAIAFFERARDIQREIGEVRGVALCQRRIGQMLARQGKYDGAVAQMHAAAAIMRDLGDHTQYARALMEIGTTMVHANRAAAAEAPLHEARDLMRRFGSPYYLAEVLSAVAEFDHATGNTASARVTYREAAELYESVEDPKADVMRTRLDHLG